MDTSEQYIKMCEKAHKVIYPDGQIIRLYDQLTLYWDVDSKRIWSGLEMTYKYNIYGSMSTNDFRDCFPIYRQDQLQKMVLSDYGINNPRWAMEALIDCLGDEINKFGSHEQVWLGFVMRERHRKIWVDGEWIEDRG